MQVKRVNNKERQGSVKQYWKTTIGDNIVDTLSFWNLFSSGQDAFQPHPPYSQPPPPRQCCVSFSPVCYYNPTALDGGMGFNGMECSKWK